MKRPNLTPVTQVFTPNEVYRELLRARSGEPFIVDTDKGSIHIGSNIGLGWDCTVISSLGPVPKNIPAIVQPVAEITDRGREEWREEEYRGEKYRGEESDTEWDGLGPTAPPRDPPPGRRYAQPCPRLPARPGRSIRDLANFHSCLDKPPVATPVLQAPLQPVGEASLKKEGKESKEPQEPQEPKEYGNPPSESQATEAKTVAETKDAGGSSTLHSGGTTNGGD